MRQRFSAAGFTLIELLVVVVIIGILAALVFPAVNAARERARNLQCVNNQSQIGKAMVAHATQKGGLPGYVENKVGVTLSWAALLLPNLDETTRYDALLEEDTAKAFGNGTDVFVLKCPSARRNGSGTSPVLDYVVNCGPVQTGGVSFLATPSKAPYGKAASGSIFVDRRLPENVKRELDSLKDGLSTTILLTENKLAGTWFLSNWGSTDTTKPADILSARFGCIDNLGFVWNGAGAAAGTGWGTGNERNFQPNGPYVLTYAAGRLQRTAEDTFSDGNTPVNRSTYGVNFARPFSAHAGSFNVLLGDGAVKSLNSDDLDAAVYLKQVCPEDSLFEASKANGGYKDDWAASSEGG